MGVRAWIVAIVAALGISGVEGAPASAQEPPGWRRIFTSDSLSLGPSAPISPDGRWVVMPARRATSTSLWIASTRGGPPQRLTSEGYYDQGPQWFASGDRILFHSNRPHRNGGRKNYLMVLAIDRATGRPVGVPRQITSETVMCCEAPSPDGRLVAYRSEETRALKLVPVNGGLARVLTPALSVTRVGFDRSGKHLYYLQEEAPGPSVRNVLKRVPVDGGTPEVVATASHAIWPLPADPSYIVHWFASAISETRYELRSLDGRLAGRITKPTEFQAYTAFTGDGWGLMGVSTEVNWSIRITPVDGGKTRVVTASGRNYLEAWMPDGSALISDRPDGVEVLPIGEGARRFFPLPAGYTWGGWQGSVGPYYSYRIRPSYTSSQDLGLPLYALDVRTGETRQIAQSAVSIGTAGRGGFEEDGSRWTYVERAGDGGLELRSADPATGESRVIRHFPPDFKLSGGGGFSVHGDQVLYGQNPRDSTELMLAVGATGEPRRLASFWNPRGPTWSWRGDRIAVLHESADPNREILTVIDVPRVNGAFPQSRSFDLGPNQRCVLPTWLPDDSAIVMQCLPPGDRFVKLRLQDGRLSTILSGDESLTIPEYLLSPDGRYVAYDVRFEGGSSISVADFKSMVQAKR